MEIREQNEYRYIAVSLTNKHEEISSTAADRIPSTITSPRFDANDYPFNPATDAIMQPPLATHPHFRILLKPCVKVGTGFLLVPVGTVYSIRQKISSRLFGDTTSPLLPAPCRMRRCLMMVDGHYTESFTSVLSIVVVSMNKRVGEEILSALSSNTQLVRLRLRTDTCSCTRVHVVNDSMLALVVSSLSSLSTRGAHM